MRKCCVLDMSSATRVRLCCQGPIQWERGVALRTPALRHLFSNNASCTAVSPGVLPRTDDWAPPQGFLFSWPGLKPRIYISKMIPGFAVMLLMVQGPCLEREL